MTTRSTKSATGSGLSACGPPADDERVRRRCGQALRIGIPARSSRLSTVGEAEFVLERDSRGCRLRATGWRVSQVKSGILTRRACGPRRRATGQKTRSAQTPGSAVAEPVEDLAAEVRHADRVRIRKRDGDAQVGAVPIVRFDELIHLAADVLRRLLHAREEFVADTITERRGAHMVGSERNNALFGTHPRAIIHAAQPRDGPPSGREHSTLRQKRAVLLRSRAEGRSGYGGLRRYVAAPPQSAAAHRGSPGRAS